MFRIDIHICFLVLNIYILYAVNIFEICFFRQKHVVKVLCVGFAQNYALTI